MSFWANVTAYSLCLILLGCDAEEPVAENAFDTPAPVSIPVLATIAEASGIADSKTNPGYLWVHEDGGNPAQLYLLAHNGTVAKTIYVQGVQNRDWEDMALSGKFLYIADIGDNDRKNEVNTIYRFVEPAATADTIAAQGRIQFSYPDGAHDAEAFLVDPVSKDIFVITKRDSRSLIYKISFPYSLTTVNSAELVGTLPYNGVVSAALSDDGRGIIVKTYTGLSFYKRDPSETIAEALQANRSSLPYLVEPQGEAVTFSVQKKGYFTLSEKAFANKVNLNFYKLK